MCKKTITVVIYSCGTRNEQQTRFEPCDKLNEPGHEVKVAYLGSSRVRDACGQYTCPRCASGAGSTTTTTDQCESKCHVLSAHTHVLIDLGLISWLSGADAGLGTRHTLPRCGAWDREAGEAVEL